MKTAIRERVARANGEEISRRASDALGVPSVDDRQATGVEERETSRPWQTNARRGFAVRQALRSPPGRRF